MKRITGSLYEEQLPTAPAETVVGFFMGFFVCRNFTVSRVRVCVFCVRGHWEVNLSPLERELRRSFMGNRA